MFAGLLAEFGTVSGFKAIYADNADNVLFLVELGNVGIPVDDAGDFGLAGGGEERHGAVLSVKF